MKFPTALLFNKTIKLTSNLFLAFLLIALGSCAEKETPGGVKYTIIKSGDGVEPAFGNFLVMNMELKDSKDSVWYASKDNGGPLILPVPDASMLKDEGEFGVFKVLTKGDSVSFKLPASTIFSKTRRRAIPSNVDSSALFTFRVGLKDVWDQNKVNEFQQRSMEENARTRAKSDSTTIANYLVEKNISNALSTPSGLRYIITKQGSGENATPGKTAYVHYAGYLLDGTLFDTSLASVAKEKNFNNGGRNAPYPVVVNAGGVISGWDEIIQLMNKGMKVIVYVPSALAYGGQSRGPAIPPNSILVFDMEVVDIN